MCFLFLKGHRKSLSEPGVSCSKSMSLGLHRCIFGFWINNWWWWWWTNRRSFKEKYWGQCPPNRGAESLSGVVNSSSHSVVVRGGNSFWHIYGINFAAGVSLVGKNVTFCSARYNFKMCDFISGVVNVTRAIQQYCRSAMSESVSVCSCYDKVSGLVWIGWMNIGQRWNL